MLVHNSIYFRDNIIGMACKYGHSQCTLEASQLFKKWLADPGLYIEPNLRSLVYTYGMIASSTPAAWEIILERYLAEINAQVNASYI